MADMGPLISEADKYGDERFAEGAKSRQAEVDDLTTEAANLSRNLANSEAAYDDLQEAFDAHMATHAPVEPLTPTRQMSLGMSALPSEWASTMAAVGQDGITARRIFCDSMTNPKQRDSLVRAAIAAGMAPVISFKGTPTPSACDGVRAYLDSLGVTVYATWHHEPYDDMTGPEFRAGIKTFAQRVRTERVKVGPILHGWLLDNKVSEFAAYSDAELLKTFDWFGIDSYETAKKVSGDRVPVLVKWLKDQGRTDMPIVIGEWNGKSAESIKRSSEAFLSEPQVSVACFWNNVGSGAAEATPLTGDRLAAFKATKADPRVIK